VCEQRGTGVVFWDDVGGGGGGGDAVADVVRGVADPINEDLRLKILARRTATRASGASRASRSRKFMRASREFISLSDSVLGDGELMMSALNQKKYYEAVCCNADRK
jgi:hypothetical protein